MSAVALTRPKSATIPLKAVRNCTIVSVIAPWSMPSVEMWKKLEQESKIVTIDAHTVFDRYHAFSVFIINSFFKWVERGLILCKAIANDGFEHLSAEKRDLHTAMEGISRDP